MIRIKNGIQVRIVKPNDPPFFYRRETIREMREMAPSYTQCFFAFHTKFQIIKSTKKPKKHWIFFSHGIGGNADTYSHLAYSLASMGYTVCMVEHEDGTACYAEENETKHPNNPDKTIKCILKTGITEHGLRMIVEKEIHQRVEELKNVIDTLCPTGSNYSLLGHSFGASTVFCVSSILKKKPKHMILYDLWIEPMLYFYYPKYNPKYRHDDNWYYPFSTFSDGHNQTMPDYDLIFSNSKYGKPKLDFPIQSFYSQTFSSYEETKIRALFVYLEKKVKHESAYGLTHTSFGDFIYLASQMLCYVMRYGNREMYQHVVDESCLFLDDID